MAFLVSKVVGDGADHMDFGLCMEAELEMSKFAMSISAVDDTIG